LKKQAEIARKAVLSTLRNRAEALLNKSGQQTENDGKDELAILLNELEIYELELEMQNDELKASYYELELERQKFAELFNAAPIGYLILNQNGVIAEINDAGEVLLDFKSKSAANRTLAGFIYPDDRYDYYGFINRLNTHPNRAQCEVRIFSVNEEIRFVRLDASLVVNSISDEKVFYITMHDITDSKKVQEQIKETTDRLNETLQASLTGTWRYKPYTNTFHLDLLSRRIFDVGDDLEKMTVDKLLTIIIDDDKQKLTTAFESGTKEVDVELRIETRLGEAKTILLKGNASSGTSTHNHFSGIIVDVSARKKIFNIEEELKQANQRLIRRTAIEAQEKERDKISASLHNSVCQILYGIRFNINHFQKKEFPGTILSSINELLDLAIKELRTISVELSPSILKDFGFVSGINDMVARLGNSGFKVSATVDAEADLLPEETQLYVFRIIQELLNNSIKHSGAQAATLTVSIAQKEVTIIVSDEGKGLPEDTDQALKSGSGIRGIKNRVSLLNGTLDISNQEGAKFTIRFQQSD